jgi:SAM-dependent methyltransferase
MASMDSIRVNGVAPGRDLASAEWLDRRARHLVRNIGGLLPKDKQSPLLEIGCGAGTNLLAIAALGYADLRGVDYCDSQIRLARGLFGLPYTHCSDALEFLRTETRRYRCILALDVLEHLALGYLLEFGEQVKRCLEPGGTVIVRVPNALSPLNPLASGDLTHVRAFSRRSLTQFFTASGLDPITVREESLPRHNLRSSIRAVAWSFAVRPAVALAATLIHGPASWSHPFTANIVAAARRPAEASAPDGCSSTDAPPLSQRFGGTC